MKRLLYTLFAVLCIAGTTRAQVVYSQDFEGAAPWGMTTVDNLGGSHTWASNTLTAYSNLTGGTGNCAEANSDGFCDFVGWDTYLFSPVIDLSSATSASVSFKSNFQDFAGTGDAEFSVSSDGITWTVLYAQTNDDPPVGAGVVGNLVLTYDLTAFAGGDLYMRWRYDDDNDGCSWYWQIDDVQVTAGGGGPQTGVGVSFPSACALGIAIPDNSCPAQTTTSVAVSGLNNLDGVNTYFESVDVTFTQTWDGDLDFFLISPAGTVIELSTDNGGSGDNYGNPANSCNEFTRFSITGITPITSGTAPFIGTYAAEGNLNTFNTNGENPNGNWTLQVCDDAVGDNGFIQYFSVNFIVPPAPPAYCVPASVDNCSTFFEHIENFELNTINNPSTCDASGYSDFTSLSTTLQEGVPSTATVTVGIPWFSDVADVWIDLNQDGDFGDVGELLATDLPLNGNLCTGSILIAPGTATLGTTRLRVSVRDGSFDVADPCQTLAYGEFEDYTVTILAAPACLPVTSQSVSNVSTTSAQLNWVTTGAQSYDVRYRAVGDPNWIFVGNFPDPTSSTVVSPLVAQTQYEFQVQARCSANDTSGWSASFVFSTSCFDCPQGGVAENEVCGGDANGGCNNLGTPTYEPITPGVPVCGTSFADAQFRDTDWYEFTLNGPATVTVTLNSDFPGAAAILDVSGGCNNLNIIDFQTTDVTCATTVATANLCAGTYIAFAAPSVFEGFPCGSSSYNLLVDVAPQSGGPSNVTACDAIPLTVGASCSPTQFDNIGAAFCPGEPDPGCASFNGQSVWFQLVVPASGDVTISGGAGTITDGGMAAYTGLDCNNLTQIACDDDSGPGFLPTINLTGLNPGDIVWIQYWAFGGGTGTFTICAYDCDFVPGAGTPENEACFSDLNGGCNMGTPTYQDLSCNETVVGTSYYDGNLRDTDWYTYTITTTTSVSWSVQADFAPIVLILNDDCNNIQVLAQATGNPCDQVTAQAVLGPGVYRFFVAPDFSNLFDCTSDDGDYQATLNVSVPDASIGAPSDACVADAPFNIIAANPGGTFSSNGAGIVDALNGVFDPAAAGAGTWDVYYSITQNGCTVGDTISINVQDIPATASTPAGTTQLCFNPADETYTVTDIAGADSYNWILTPTGAGVVTGTGSSVTINFDDNFSGTASLVVAPVNECGTGGFSPSLDIVITPLPGTAGTPAGPNSLCQGALPTDYTTAGDPASDSYTWNIVTTPASSSSISGTGTTATVTWDPAFVGTADITVTPSNSCGTGTVSATYTVTINSVAPAVIDPVSNAICVSASPTQLTATPAGGTWSGTPDVSANGVFTPSSAGAYAITYTPNGGCSSPATLLINVGDVPATPSAPLGITSQCQDGPNTTVFVIPVAGADSYTWSFTPDPDAGTSTDNGTSLEINWASDFFGQASVIVSANNGCGSSLFSQPWLIDINPTPEPIITQVGPFCQGPGSYPLSADIPGGFWGGSNGVNGANFTPSLGSLGTNNIIYQVTVDGCTGDDTIQVVVQPAPVVTITAPSSICTNDGAVAFTGAPVGGTFGGDLANDGTFANNFGPGTYTATYNYDNGFGCAGSATVDFDVNALPVASFSYSAQCQALTFFNESQFATPTNSSSLWQFGDGNTFNGFNTSYVYGVDGNYTVTLTVTNACGTSDTSITVQVIKCVGVEENAVVDQLSVFPNPTEGLLNVFFTSNKAQNYQINLVDITGKVLYTEYLNNFVGQYNNPMDLTNVASGMYIFRIMGEDGKAANIKVVRD